MATSGSALTLPAADASSAAGAVAGHALGPADAPATLHVFGTYECLHCRLAWPALRALADDGLARVVWHHFAPPGAFPHAAAAAAAAESAADQGAFWAAHDALMGAPAPLWPEAAVGAVAPLVPDVARWRTGMPGPAVQARLAAQRDAALALGVRGTPSVFLMPPAGAPGRAPERVDASDERVLRDRLAAARA